MALYRKWRPQTFDEVVGQEATVAALRHSIASASPAHAYLFCGTRGTGKTSMAKIFARALNCLAPDKRSNPCNHCEVCKSILDASLLDVVEMDAASNNSVEDIRRIIEEVAYLPALAKYKIYIIDEVHMLSNAAFNALLKTLEEPPAHVIFILATTEPRRIPATIHSRCQRYDFRRIPEPQIAARLKEVAADLGLTIDREALKLLVQLADGALRDALSLLDQASNLHASSASVDGPLLREEVLQMAGRSSDDLILALMTAITTRQALALTKVLEKVSREGLDYGRFCLDTAIYYRHLLLLKSTSDDAVEAYIPLSAERIQVLRKFLGYYELPELLHVIERLEAIASRLKNQSEARLTLEVALLALIAERERANEASEKSPAEAVVKKKSKPADEPTPEPATKLSSKPASERAATKPERTGNWREAEMPKQRRSHADDVQAAKARRRQAEESGRLGQVLSMELESPFELSDLDPANQEALTDEDLAQLPALPSIEEMQAAWPRILDELAKRGQMAMSMMIRGRSLIFDYGQIKIICQDHEARVFERLCSAEAKLIFEEVLEAVFPQKDIRISPIFAEDVDRFGSDEKKKQSEADWITKVRELCDENGIPLEIKLKGEEPSL